MKKIEKPAYIIDMTKCNDTRSLITEITVRQIISGSKVSMQNYIITISTILNKIIDEIPPHFIILREDNTKNKTKKNIFKRFWNWVTRKNK